MICCSSVHLYGIKRYTGWKGTGVVGYWCLLQYEEISQFIITAFWVRYMKERSLMRTYFPKGVQRLSKEGLSRRGVLRFRSRSLKKWTRQKNGDQSVGTTASMNTSSSKRPVSTNAITKMMKVVWIESTPTRVLGQGSSQTDENWRRVYNRRRPSVRDVTRRYWRLPLEWDRTITVCRLWVTGMREGMTGMYWPLTVRWGP